MIKKQKSFQGVLVENNLGKLMAQRIYLNAIKSKGGRKGQRIIDNGLDLASAILLSFKELGEDFLRSLPSSYPGFKMIKDMFGIQGYLHGQIKEMNDSSIRSSLYRLNKQGLLAKDANKKIYYLTDEGEKIALEIKNRYSATSERSWDGKLRLFFFDIPESKKGWREAIRRELAVAQFYQLQKSVYIGKYPLPEDFYCELEDNNISRFVFLLTVGEIDRREEVLRLLENNGR
jgi:DNA-binding PadR family transcriptional regulator